MPFTFGLLFLAPGPNGLAGPPISCVYVKTSTKQSYRGVNPDLSLLTPEAVTADELGQYCDALCEELQQIKRQGARKYGAHRRRA